MIIGIQNLTSTHVVITPATTMSAISAANVVLPMLTPKVNIKSASAKRTDSALSEIKFDYDQLVYRAKPKLSSEQLEKLFSKIDLYGIANWCEQEKKRLKI